jgi:hypothetical protein
MVAAIASGCALAVHVTAYYAAAAARMSTAACPEVYFTPAILLWIILGSMAVFAWRRCSVTRVAFQATVSCLLVMSRLWEPPGASSPGVGLYYKVFWPVAGFAIFVVAPLWLRRFWGVSEWVLVLADAFVVAVLADLFVMQPFLP